jgi:hypothetical protein
MSRAATDAEHVCAVCETTFSSEAELEQHVHDTGLVG